MKKKLWKYTKKDYTTNGNIMWMWDRWGETRELKWGENITNTANGGVLTLCNDAWLHAYESPVQAALFKQFHLSGLDGHVLWEAEGEVGLSTGDKVGCTSLTTLKQTEDIRFTDATAQALEKEVRNMIGEHRPLHSTELRRSYVMSPNGNLEPVESIFYNAAYAIRLFMERNWLTPQQLDMCWERVKDNVPSQ